MPSESSSTLPTLLANAFPLPPSSPGISSAIVAVQQKVRGRGIYNNSSNEINIYFINHGLLLLLLFRWLNASSSAPIVPSGDQKIRMRGRREIAMTMELEDYEEDPMCSGTY
jgi:hypothetical protein